MLWYWYYLTNNLALYPEDVTDLQVGKTLSALIRNKYGEN